MEKKGSKNRGPKTKLPIGKQLPLCQMLVQLDDAILNFLCSQRSGAEAVLVPNGEDVRVRLQVDLGPEDVVRERRGKVPIPTEL